MHLKCKKTKNKNSSNFFKLFVIFFFLIFELIFEIIKFLFRYSIRDLFLGKFPSLIIIISIVALKKKIFIQCNQKWNGKYGIEEIYINNKKIVYCNDNVKLWDYFINYFEIYRIRNRLTNFFSKMSWSLVKWNILNKVLLIIKKTCFILK